MIWGEQPFGRGGGVKPVGQNDQVLQKTVFYGSPLLGIKMLNIYCVDMDIVIDGALGTPFLGLGASNGKKRHVWPKMGHFGAVSSPLGAHF